MRDLRNRLKSTPTGEDVSRLTYLSAEWFPLTGNLRNEVGILMCECLTFMDFVGDYCFMMIVAIRPIYRLEQDSRGQERSVLSEEHIALYKWFNCDLSAAEIGHHQGKVGTADRDLMMGLGR